jgi:glucokinase
MQKYAVGIDIGGTRTKIGLVDLEYGRVINLALTPTEKYDAGLFLDNLYQQYTVLTNKAGITHQQMAGLGIGVPGFVYEDGSVDSTYGFLPFMDNHYNLKKELELKFRLPCLVDNDARVVALGESLFGRGKGFSRVLVLTLGTGLGLGFVAGGRFETKLPYSHMAGHLTVATTNTKCYCGKQGCLESLVSASGIIDMAVRAGWEQKYPDLPLEVESVFNAEQQSDALAIQIVSGFLGYLKTGIDNYINIYAPDIIVIGGGVSKGMKPYLERLGEINSLNPYSGYKVEIALSELDESSGILGSAALFTL